MADVFLSYKSEDQAAVEPLVRALETGNFNVWWDRSIVPGEHYAEVIRRALDSVSCVVVAWSRRSIESNWVQDEACFARDRRILVPVSLDGTLPPLGFGQLQTVNLADWNGRPDDPRIQHLLAGIRRLVGARGRTDQAPISPAETVNALYTGQVPSGQENAHAIAGKTSKRFLGRWPTRAALLAAGAVGSAACLAAVLYYFFVSPTVHVAPGPVPVERSFTDCKAGCPVMIVVPTGSFMMGSPDNELQRGNDEGSQHTVTIPKVLAVAKYPVTFDQWDFCHSHGGCTDLFPSDNNWRRGAQPVINVSWEDAKSYVAWLSKFTGQAYRLLSEAEREYIARAGTTTAFWWGNNISTNLANYDGTKRYTDEPAGPYRQQPLPVDAFRPNPWGFYQVSGNTWDWVEDCYHDSYERAPADGSAWTTGDCSRRVLRGGSWGSQPRNIRSAARWKQPIETREPYYGFRIARVCDSGCNF